MNFTPNPDGMNNLFAEIANKIKRVDTALRAEWTGKPAEEIEGPAIAAFAAVGVNFTSLKDYSESVSRNEPFQIDVG